MENIAKLTSYGCYLDCDFVTAKYPGDETHIVGNVAEYVYDLEQKISDLETKLAEMTEKYNACQEARKLEIEFNQQDKAELKQQLAEKEKELKAKETLNQIFKDNRETKISFAVEQLEKAKSFCISAEDNGWCITHKDWLDIVEYIDNQIKELKETT